MIAKYLCYLHILTICNIGQSSNIGNGNVVHVERQKRVKFKN